MKLRIGALVCAHSGRLFLALGPQLDGLTSAEHCPERRRPSPRECEVARQGHALHSRAPQQHHLVAPNSSHHDLKMAHLVVLAAAQQRSTHRLPYLLLTSGFKLAEACEHAA